MVATRAPNDLGVGPGKEVEARAGRVAGPTVEIGVFHDDHSTGSYRLPHLLKHPHRLRQMLQEETGVYDVVGSRFAPLVEVNGPELNIGDSPGNGSFACETELDFIHIDP